MLALFLVLFMALGLLIRPLMANVNRMVARQVRDGGLFNGEDVDIPVRPYRISQIMRALSDKDTYATALQQRYATFNRWYPRLMKGALVLGVAVPVVLAVIFALTPTEKVWLLTGWLIWIIVIFVALVVIEPALQLRAAAEAREPLRREPDRPVRRHGGRGAGRLHGCARCGLRRSGARE
ncbi:MAG: hypothetical protein ACLSDQ_01520 [Adlercreutzia equolifaciens]